MPHYMHIKIHNSAAAARYIPLIRRFSGASIREIGEGIKTGWALSFDWEKRASFDEDYNGIDHHADFRALVADLLAAGADLSLYQQFGEDVEEITLQLLDNLIERDRLIAEQTQRMIDLELGETE